LLRVVFFAVVFQVAGLVWSWGLCVRFAGCWFYRFYRFYSSATLHITQYETAIICLVTINHRSYSCHSCKYGWIFGRYHGSKGTEEGEGVREVQRDAANEILSLIQVLNSVIHEGPKTQGGHNTMEKTAWWKVLSNVFSLITIWRDESDV